MKRTEILAVGTELLMGQIVNTNARYISSRLPGLGISVLYHTVVGDNPERLAECIKLALDRTDLVIMTGGLGPTRDDLTKETAAKAMNKKLVLDEKSYRKIQNFFNKLGRPMAENNKKQAMLPEDSIILENNKGTAPGCIMENNGKAIAMLPGPPSEMVPMFENQLVPYLKKFTGYNLVSKYLRIFGIGESSMEEKILDLVDSQTNPTIAPYAKEGEVVLRITARYEGEEQDIITPVVNKIKERIGDYVYYVGDEESSMDEIVAGLLIEKDITISIAESCTGGLIASRLSAFSGISRVFDRSIVVYSNTSKIQELGVKQSTLEMYGAVSKQTCEEMSAGIKEISGTRLAVSVTGIAGPSGGTPEKPVGLVYVSLASDEGIVTRELRLGGDRDRIRNVSVLNALDMIRIYCRNLK